MTNERTRFVNLEASILEQFLQERGADLQKPDRDGKKGQCTRIVQGSEIVYVYTNKYHPSVKVKVYTSIRAGEKYVRRPGKDAIRVCTVYEGVKAITRGRNNESRSFGIYKAQRIHRTGSEEAIIERLHDRMQEAYRVGNEWLREHWKEVTTP